MMEAAQRTSSKDYYDRSNSYNSPNRNLAYPSIGPTPIVEEQGMDSTSIGLANAIGRMYGTPTKLIPYCLPSPLPPMSNPFERMTSEPYSSFSEASMGSDCGDTLLPRRLVDPDANFSKFPTPLLFGTSPNLVTQQQRRSRRSPRSRKRGRKRRRKRHAQQNKDKAQANKQTPKRKRPKSRQLNNKPRQLVTSDLLARPSKIVDSIKDNKLNVTPIQSTCLDTSAESRPTGNSDCTLRARTVISTQHGELQQMTPLSQARKPPKKVKTSYDNNTAVKSRQPTYLDVARKLEEPSQDDEDLKLTKLSCKIVKTNHDGKLQQMATTMPINARNDPIQLQHGTAIATNNQLAHTGNERPSSVIIQVEPLDKVGISKSIVDAVTLIDLTLDEGISFIRNFNNATVSANNTDSTSETPKHPSFPNGFNNEL